MGILSFLFGRREAVRTIVEGDGAYDFEIVGESRYQDALEQLCGGRCKEGVEYECTATLTPEPKNRHDPNAIRVDIRRHTVGYLSRPNAADYHRQLKRAGVRAGPMACEAMIVGGWDRRGQQGHFGVKLDMCWPLQIR